MRKDYKKRFENKWQNELQYAWYILWQRTPSDDNKFPRTWTNRRILDMPTTLLVLPSNTIPEEVDGKELYCMTQVRAIQPPLAERTQPMCTQSRPQAPKTRGNQSVQECGRWQDPNAGARACRLMQSSGWTLPGRVHKTTTQQRAKGWWYLSLPPKPRRSTFR